LVRISFRCRKFFPERGGTGAEQEGQIVKDSKIDWLNLDDISSVGAVYFSLKLDEFLSYTPIEFNRLLEIKEEARTSEYRQSMSIMRLQTMTLVNVQLAVKDRFKKLESFMPFDWDNEGADGKQDTGEIEMTEDDWNALDDISAGKLNKKN
jgi:hypothetical protein